MDYSLLLGIHHSDRIMPTETLIDEKEDDFDVLQKMPTPDRRQSHYGLKNQQVVLSATTDFSGGELPAVDETAIERSHNESSQPPSPKQEVIEKKQSGPQ
jgi:hypothetical protein